MIKKPPGKPVAQIRAGKSKPVNFLIGELMRKIKGKADPKKVMDLNLKRLA